MSNRYYLKLKKTAFKLMIDDTGIDEDILKSITVQKFIDSTVYDEYDLELENRGGLDLNLINKLKII